MFIDVNQFASCACDSDMIQAAWTASLAARDTVRSSAAMSAMMRSLRSPLWRASKQQEDKR